VDLPTQTFLTLHLRDQGTSFHCVRVKAAFSSVPDTRKLQ